MQQQPHLAELGEDQCALTKLEQLVDQFVEASELARTADEARAIARGMRWVIADLLESRQRGEHQTAPLHSGLGLRVGEQLIDHRLVHRGLLASEGCPRHLLDLVGQLGQQCFVGFGAAKNERLREGAQRSRGGGVASSLDGLRVLVVERVGAAIQAGVHRIENGPQLAKVVFYRRARERQLLIGVDVSHGACCAGEMVLHILCFVEHQGAPLHFAQRIDVASEQAVGGDHNV